MTAKPTIERLIREVESFNTERDWDQFHSVKNLSMALSVEVAELVQLSQWLSQEESNKPTEKLLECYKDESADVLIYLLLICRKLDFDVIEAALAKIKKNRSKYPVEKSKGSRQKYNDL